MRKSWSLTLLIGLVLALSGCGVFSSDGEDTKLKTGEQASSPGTSEEEAVVQKDREEPEEEQSSEENPNLTNTDEKADEEHIRITSGEAAIEYLKVELDSDINMEDTSFYVMGDGPEDDEEGTYFTIQLVSKSLQKGGGSGTIGLYKVYENGTSTLKN